MITVYVFFYNVDEIALGYLAIVRDQVGAEDKRYKQGNE